jgi:hypothetical protein
MSFCRIALRSDTDIQSSPAQTRSSRIILGQGFNCYFCIVMTAQKPSNNVLSCGDLDLSCGDLDLPCADLDSSCADLDVSCAHLELSCADLDLSCAILSEATSPLQCVNLPKSRMWTYTLSLPFGALELCVFASTHKIFTFTFSFTNKQTNSVAFSLQAKYTD